jgi:acyl-CoA synthetase (AMP-forming)/AMP-acid ligase II
LVEPLTGRAWNSDEIVVRVRDRTRFLVGVGLRRGDRVSLHYGNNLDFFVDLLAIWFCGACAIPLDGRLTPFEISTLLRAARPKISIWAESPDAATEAALRELGVLALTAGSSVARHADAPPPAMHLDDEALILFTSGTTGDPKGVVHSHRSLRARWTSLFAALGIDAFARTLCLLPTHFGHGLICNCLYPWLYGKDLYVLPPFRADVLLKLGALIDEHAITFMSSVPTVWRLATKTAKPPKNKSLQRVFCGSAPLSGDLWRNTQAWAGTSAVFNAYGITETGSWLAGTTIAFDDPEDGLIGRAWGGTIRVLASRDSTVSPAWADECAPGESGHIWVQTPALMKGYLDREDLTAAVVADGWLATGDIGLIDDRGYLYLRGREREEINKGGMKVYPGDVDAVIERFPQTLDVCTFALDDALLGEDVGVAVVLERHDETTLASLAAWTNEHLAAHQRPKTWYRLDEIPRTSRGKVNRRNVADACKGRAPLRVAGPARDATR